MAEKLDISYKNLLKAPLEHSDELKEKCPKFYNEFIASFNKALEYRAKLGEKYNAPFSEPMYGNRLEQFRALVSSPSRYKEFKAEFKKEEEIKEKLYQCISPCKKLGCEAIKDEIDIEMRGIYNNTGQFTNHLERGEHVLAEISLEQARLFVKKFDELLHKLSECCKGD